MCCVVVVGISADACAMSWAVVHCITMMGDHRGSLLLLIDHSLPSPVSCFLFLVSTSDAAIPEICLYFTFYFLRSIRSRVCYMLCSFLFSVLHALENGLDHLIAHLRSLWEHVLEELLGAFELSSVEVEVTVFHSTRPFTGRHGELQIILAKCYIVNGNVDAVFKQRRRAEEVLCDTEENPE